MVAISPVSDVIPAYPGFSTGSIDSFIYGEKGAIAGQLFVKREYYFMSCKKLVIDLNSGFYQLGRTLYR
jgi:hypothetical protein